MSTASRCSRIAAALFILTALSSPCAVPAQTSASSAEVQTLAGSGRAGIDDGPAASASFLLPVGVAAAPDGSIYIADRDAQRIRRLQNGVVSTVAGTGALAADGRSVLGGHRDGPAAQSQFNMPSGLAVGTGGVLYIADSGNGCVRKLDHGVVSTVAGKPGDKRSVDGDAATGRLTDPRALAFDRRGNLYVADYGGGLRMLSRDGKLTTVPTSDKRVFGVAVDNADSDGIIYTSSPVYLIATKPSDHSEDRVQLTLNGDGTPIGYPDALVALNHRELLFTDIQANNVRYLRLSARPFVNGPFSRVVAGGGFAHPVENAGFHDGELSASRFYEPAGITIQGKSAVVTDGGNRRIRRFPLPQSRLSEVGFTDTTPVDKQHFEVLYIGASSTYFDAIGPDSVCGQIEANLNASHKLPRPVRCHQVRTDGPSLISFHDYVTNFVAPRGMDLVLMQMSTYEVSSMDPKLAYNAMFVKMRAKVQDIIDSLKPTHTKVGLIWAYAGSQLSASEYFYGREVNPRDGDLPLDGYDWHLKTVRAYIDAVKNLDVIQYDSFDDLIAYQRTSGARPLWATIDDVHPNARLNIYFGKLISDYLLSLPQSAWVPKR
ncbi:MAG: hypothetical protein M3169_01485 [Candidatus Eremiobacteraeota bacterium]|nr:hypothetical protein [Candidatus Eremiobacteraeota bacterium]